MHILQELDALFVVNLVKIPIIESKINRWVNFMPKVLEHCGGIRIASSDRVGF